MRPQLLSSTEGAAPTCNQPVAPVYSAGADLRNVLTECVSWDNLKNLSESPLPHL